MPDQCNHPGRVRLWPFRKWADCITTTSEWLHEGSALEWPHQFGFSGTTTVDAVVEERTQASLESYYRQFTAEELRTIRAIAMDMWEPYILATAACVPDAAQKIVFDHYHATRSVKKEAAGTLNLDLVRDNRMPGRGRSA